MSSILACSSRNDSGVVAGEDFFLVLLLLDGSDAEFSSTTGSVEITGKLLPGIVPKTSVGVNEGAKTFSGGETSTRAGPIVEETTATDELTGVRSVRVGAEYTTDCKEGVEV